ncbi:NAD-dependent aldehyde dehydrogenase [Colletotrichum salicis]|uniref:NAD-dependent aldehyde dehydrogenase n=1 Tax=Colletotrichum salicis TaxID=1209931 RepID=A0A135TE19_9PEZI|nr:NAD-dependent aldehyde dehydrogenase [Colletotrichum salicis]
MSSLASSLKDPILFVQKSYINGQWALSDSGNTFQVTNPATEELIGTCPESKFKVTGQTCVRANRIFVQEGIYDRFSQRLVEEVEKFRVGNGTDALVPHGPLTNGVGKVEEHIKDAISKNAKVLLGGNRLPSAGKNFHELTILGDVDDSMKVTQEETFGPTCGIDEVLHRKGDQLGYQNFWTLEWLPSTLVSSQTLLRRVKHSGFGREGSKYGLEDYLTIKMIVTGDISTRL